MDDLDLKDPSDKFKRNSLPNEHTLNLSRRSHSNECQQEDLISPEIRSLQTVILNMEEMFLRSQEEKSSYIREIEGQKTELEEKLQFAERGVGEALAAKREQESLLIRAMRDGEAVKRDLELAQQTVTELTAQLKGEGKDTEAAELKASNTCMAQLLEELEGLVLASVAKLYIPH
eukprot:CAMPEP_0196587722 /NCGR_PEP_ID=MMETSP1081-20130531/58403_1 /TAXON_ID=36882 /ORGANISM="Pyramimonas amylifera, Strain CCMP720" /LENGTH=174 /DNA_ID=CAMNT_0041909987 /DNA_START=129 /DNA_END=654 /DNA_ORIENTATION=+